MSDIDSIKEALRTKVVDASQSPKNVMALALINNRSYYEQALGKAAETLVHIHEGAAAAVLDRMTSEDTVAMVATVIHNLMNPPSRTSRYI
ncbi:MAG: hypothetical protein AB7L92_00215 [Alphaproteobacteria bacterium]